MALQCECPGFEEAKNPERLLYEGFLHFFNFLGESQSCVKVGVRGILQADTSLFCPCFKPTGHKPALHRKPYSCASEDVEPQPRLSAGLVSSGLGLYQPQLRVLSIGAGLRLARLECRQGEPLSACQIPCRHTLPHPR